MNNTKLSLADFKAKADKVETSEVLGKIQGGDNGDCHIYAKLAEELRTFTPGN
jgi:hypothetical protein